MKATQEEGQVALGIGDDEVLVCAHENDGVHIDVEAFCVDAQGVEEEAADVGIGAEEEMASQRSAGDEVGGAWEDPAWLGHA